MLCSSHTRAGAPSKGSGCRKKARRDADAAAAMSSAEAPAAGVGGGAAVAGSPATTACEGERADIVGEMGGQQRCEAPA